MRCVPKGPIDYIDLAEKLVRSAGSSRVFGTRNGIEKVCRAVEVHWDMKSLEGHGSTKSR